MNEAHSKSAGTQDPTARPRRRRRRDASRWRALIEQQRDSGQSVKAFCAEQDLNESSFYAWRRRLRDEANKDAGPASGFVRLDPRQGSASSEMIEVRFACGATLRCPSAHLAELVRVLKTDGDGPR